MGTDTKSLLIVAIIRIVAGGMLLYGIVCLLMFYQQDRLLFITREVSTHRLNRVNEMETPVEEAWIVAEDGTRLHGWWVNKPSGLSQNLQRIVLYYGGNAEEVSHMMEEAATFTRWSFLLMNYRGYGLSEGEPSEKLLYGDALTIYDHVMEELSEKEYQLVVMGRSLGAGVASYVARHRSADAAILISPYDSMVEVAREAYPWMPVRLLLRHRFEAERHAPYVKIPLYALVASDDEIISRDRAWRFLNQWGGDVHAQEVSGVGHNQLMATEAYHRFIHDSFRDIINQNTNNNP